MSSPQPSITPHEAGCYESTRETVQRAVELKAVVKALTYQLLDLKEHLVHLQEALVDRRPPARTDLPRLYACARFELPGAALRRFEEVEIFHDSVLANRRIHLALEIEQVKAQVDELDRQAAEADQLRSDLLKQLDERL